MTSTKPTVTTTEREFIAERMFDAPRALVFKAFSSCEHLKQWWGPHTYPTTYCKLDFRAGGVWHYCMTGPNGEEAWGKATYIEIVEPERISYRDAFSDAEGATNESMPQNTTLVEFIDVGDKTMLKTTTQFATAEDLKATVEMGMIEGLTETWDKLDAYLEKIS